MADHRFQLILIQQAHLRDLFFCNASLRKLLFIQSFIWIAILIAWMKFRKMILFLQRKCNIFLMNRINSRRTVL